MDRMIVGRDRLEGREMRVGHRPARDEEPLADPQILEIAALRIALPPRVESFGHLASGIRRVFSAHRRAIVFGSSPSSVRMAAPCSPIRGAAGKAASTAKGTPGVRGEGNFPIPGWSTATAP